MSEITLTINEETVTYNVETRTSLADYIREHHGLTGTHTACEHGVCGACTIILNGKPARSCITLAAAVENSDIRTIEGYAQDVVMDTIRNCFIETHATQCGYCTPGMLATAYDIVTRLPGAGRERIKLELSGNLCRCTGYLQIVDAIQLALSKLAGSSPEKSVPNG